MNAEKRTPWLAALLLAPPVVFFVLVKARPSLDVMVGSPASHFYVVSVVAALALGLAVAVIIAARHLPDARTLFLAMGFLSMATIFLAHGLGTSPFFGTPHAHESAEPLASYAAADEGFEVQHHHNYGVPAAAPTQTTPRDFSTVIARGKVVGYSAQLSLLVSALFFALAAVDLPARAAKAILRRWGLLATGMTALLGGHVLAALFYPQVISWVPLDETWLRLPVTCLAIAALAFACCRFYQSYTLALLPLQGAMALGMALLVEAQVFMTWGVLWHLSWWEYHAAMLGGFLMCVVCLLVQYRMTGDLGAIVEGLFLRKEIHGIRAGDPRALVALGAAVAAKDTETAEHIERVGDLAADIGLHMGVPESEIEILRWGGRLHDVGKIGVPNSILRKPGRLTEREFATMKLHSVRGGRLAERSRLLARAAPIVRGHHERIDGSGYPDGLAGDGIPLGARIVAVADFWDALVFDRPYRAALPTDEVVAMVRAASGTHLDPACVSALLAVVGADEGVELPRAA